MKIEHSLRGLGVAALLSFGAVLPASAGFVLGDSIQTALWTTGAAVEITEAAFNLAGGPALYDASPLQRRMRDMQAARQHAVVHPKNYELLGAARMGIKGGPLG